MEEKPTEEKLKVDLENIAKKAAGDAKEVSNKYSFIGDKMAIQARRAKKLSETYKEVSEFWYDVGSMPSSQYIDPAMRVSMASSAGSLNFLKVALSDRPVNDLSLGMVEYLEASGDSIASSTHAVAKFIDLSRAQRIEKSIGDRQDELRKSIAGGLPGYIGQEFLAAWENLETNYQDPSRGAAFLMRESITHILAHYTPHIQKATRAERIEDITQRLFNSSEREFVKDSLARLEDLYQELNQAHKRGPLDKQKIELYLSQATGILHIFTQKKQPEDPPKSNE